MTDQLAFTEEGNRIQQLEKELYEARLGLHLAIPVVMLYGQLLDRLNEQYGVPEEIVDNDSALSAAHSAFIGFTIDRIALTDMPTPPWHVDPAAPEYVPWAQVDARVAEREGRA